jgi:two-component system OmpR family sensor kinase
VTRSSTTATPLASPAKGRPWRALRRYSARTPLRLKLVAALLALVIAALALVSGAGIFEFRNYLLGKADHEVTQLFRYANSTITPRPDRPTINVAGQYFEAFVPSGQQLRPGLGIPPADLPNIPSSSAWLKANSGKLVTVPGLAGGTLWRVVTQYEQYPTPSGNISGTLIVGEDLGNINQTIGRLVNIDLIVGAIAVLGLALIGVGVVRASLRPLAEIEQTAVEIAAGDLSRRVPDRDPRTEVGSLGQSLNAMLAHIEAAFQAQVQSEASARRSEGRMRQFAADASHELRTPLTTIKGFAEYYRQRGGAGANGNAELSREELDRIMHRVEDEATRMGVLVEDLLLLARIDQERPLERRPVDVLAIAADAVQDARIVAPDRDVRLTVGRDTAFLVVGDEARLRQVVGNLVSNALSHTPAGTAVEVHVRSGLLPPPPPGPGGPGAAIPPGQAVILEVVDHGQGLSREQAERVFERFYRADQARTRKTGGTGLGLAIVSALVSAHGGSVSVDTEPGHGATFRIALPLAREAQGTEEPAEAGSTH